MILAYNTRRENTFSYETIANEHQGLKSKSVIRKTIFS